MVQGHVGGGVGVEVAGPVGGSAGVGLDEQPPWPSNRAGEDFPAMAAMMVSATTSAWLWANTPARGRGLPLASRIWLVSPIAYAPSKPVARGVQVGVDPAVVGRQRESAITGGAVIGGMYTSRSVVSVVSSANRMCPGSAAVIWRPGR